MTVAETATFHDRSSWGSGDWDNEPDRVEWRDESTDLPCLALRNRLGAWCGYVACPPEHPWHGLDYDSEELGDVHAHGGLTFSSFCAEGEGPERICHVPRPGEPDNVWWLGFDCAHLGDHVPAMHRDYLGRGETYRTLDYVQRQCSYLAAQVWAAR